MFGKIFGGWIVEGDLFAVHHVRQYSEVKTLEMDPISKIVSHRAYVDRRWRGCHRRRRGGHWFDDTHDNADRLLLLINAFDEDLADSSVLEL
jgi:hypothetical protein